MKPRLKLLAASASMLASAMFSGPPAARAATVNFVINFQGTATITTGDGTCGNAMCWNGGGGTYSFSAAKHCVEAYPTPNGICDVSLATGSFTTTHCGTGTLWGDADVLEFTVNGSTKTATDYSITLMGSVGTLKGHLSDGSTLSGVVDFIPQDAHGRSVELPNTSASGGACTDTFGLAVGAVS